MAEILYKYLSKEKREVNSSLYIRWLDKAELQIFNNHLELCGQSVIDNTLWDDIYNKGTIYAGLFVEDKMVARACVEKYSDFYWEVGDVRVTKSYRNHGYAHEICIFVLNYIISQQKIPTMRTEDENIIMQKVIEDLGFTLCG
ncbi:MAG: GNAT family N-acetyltransferase [Lachnospiraceae bacterium]|nr:GNAT family N-acetyltransferase [Lachnospiraceae bacterium]